MTEMIERVARVNLTAEVSIATAARILQMIEEDQ